MTPPVPHEIVAALVRAELIEPGTQPAGEPLTGGVSSDIWRVDVRDGAVCVKRALPRLRVAANWEAPVERNAFEVAWMEVAAAVNFLCGPGSDAMNGQAIAVAGGEVL